MALSAVGTDRLTPMTVIGFLHTSDAHRSVFEALVGEIDPGSHTVTVVDEELLDRARRTDPTDPAVVEVVHRRLVELDGLGAASIICTCSTLGGVAESVGDELGLDVVRVDRAMAERAVAIGGRVVVLAALESTVAPTCEPGSTEWAGWVRLARPPKRPPELGEC